MCTNLYLPTPNGNTEEPQSYDRFQEEPEADSKILSVCLCHQQFEAFNQIIHAINNENSKTRCFSLDGPGGSEKRIFTQQNYHLFKVEVTLLLNLQQ